MAKVIEVSLQVIVPDDVTNLQVEDQLEAFNNEKIWQTTYVIAREVGTMNDKENDSAD